MLDRPRIPGVVSTQRVLVTDSRARPHGYSVTLRKNLKRNSCGAFASTVKHRVWHASIAAQADGQ